jgi:hypothetical protein
MTEQEEQRDGSKPIITWNTYQIAADRAKCLAECWDEMHELGFFCCQCEKVYPGSDVDIECLAENGVCVACWEYFRDERFVPRAKEIKALCAVEAT